MGLLRIQVLHSMSILSSTRRQTCHERINLSTRSRDSHMAAHLVRHATGLRAGLAGVVSHARRHTRVAWRDSGMLLHTARMRREGGCHAGHHVSRGRLSTRVDIDASLLRYRMRLLAGRVRGGRG